MVTRLYCLSAVSVYIIFARFHTGFGQVYVANLYSLTSHVSGCIFADKNGSWIRGENHRIYLHCRSYLYVEAMEV